MKHHEERAVVHPMSPQSVWFGALAGLRHRFTDRGPAGWRSLVVLGSLAGLILSAGVGLLAGVGFTMSLFVGELAFGAVPMLDAAKVGILVASLTAGVSGYLLLRAVLPAPSWPGRSR